MEIKNKLITAVLCLSVAYSMIGYVSAATINDINTDRIFDENRTLYYIESDDSVYDLDVEGYTQIKRAESVAENDNYSSKNVSVLKNNTTGKEYRFVFTGKE